MDDDYDDYYYSKPKLSLAKGSAKADTDDDDVPTQTVKAMYCSVGVACLALGLVASSIELLQFVLFWVALAFLVGPFSPSRITGGNCQVGQGGEVEFEESEDEGDESAAFVPKGSSAAKERAGAFPGSKKDAFSLKPKDSANLLQSSSSAAEAPGKGGWTRAEWDQLKKLFVKFPRGTPQRWENVARGLSTKRSTEEVIAAFKFLSESKDKDPFAAFAAQFKGSEAAESPPVPAATQAPTPQLSQPAKPGSWSEIQDRALLEALKKFPKSEFQRWEKVAQAVGGGKAKGECMKRLTELRESLKAKKAANGLSSEAELDGLDA